MTFLFGLTVGVLVTSLTMSLMIVLKEDGK